MLFAKIGQGAELIPVYVPRLGELGMNFNAPWTPILRIHLPTVVGRRHSKPASTSS